MGIWGKFGEDFYIRMAGFHKDTFLSALFGNLETVGDIVKTGVKLNFYLFLTRFIHIKRRVSDGIA